MYTFYKYDFFKYLVFILNTLKKCIKDYEIEVISYTQAVWAIYYSREKKTFLQALTFIEVFVILHIIYNSS